MKRFILSLLGVTDTLLDEVESHMCKVAREFKEPKPVEQRYLVRYHNLSLDTLVGVDSEMEMLLDFDREVESITRVSEDMPLALDRDELRFDLCAA